MTPQIPKLEQEIRDKLNEYMGQAINDKLCADIKADIKQILRAALMTGRIKEWPKIEVVTGIHEVKVTIDDEEV